MKIKISYDNFLFCRTLANKRMQGHIKLGHTAGPSDQGKRLMIETRGIVCEWAFSRTMDDLKDQFRSDYSCRGDGGFDYTLPNGLKVDIKSCPPQHAINMVCGTGGPKRCDIYVLSRFNEDKNNLFVEFLGWIGVDDFMKLSEAGGIPTWRKPHRTLPITKLRPMYELVALGMLETNNAV